MQNMTNALFAWLCRSAKSPLTIYFRAQGEFYRVSSAEQYNPIADEDMSAEDETDK